MRTSLGIATALALALTACGGSGDEVPTVTATPSTDATEAATIAEADDEDPDTDGEGAEGEPRDEDALFGAEVCTALLPALDGDLEGLDRYATDEVLDALFNGGEPMADAAEVYEDDDATCTIAIGDYWIDLTLLGDGHVGHRAVDFSEHTSYGDGGFDDGGEYDAEGIEQAAAAWRQDPNACGGEAAELPEGMGDHQVLVTDARLIVAVVCDTFAYQSLYELTFWEDEQLFSLVAEQWQGDDLAVESMILGNLDVDDSGRLTAFEKARGPGDCGQWSAFVERGASILALDEARVRDCDDQAEYVEPEQWPLVYSRS